MKKFTPFFTMGIAAAAALSAGAQTTFAPQVQPLPNTHRTTPVVADFTNNGSFDIFYGGQGSNLLDQFPDGSNWFWQITSTLGLNLGDFFVVDTQQANPRWYDMTDEEGNPILNEDGSVQQGLAMDRVWPGHGVNGASKSTYAALDYNNDGLVDLLVMGCQEWDIFDYNGTYGDKFLYLYKNLGDGKFELVPEAAFPQMRQDGGNGGENPVHYAIAVGDYDNDGYVDFAVSVTEYKNEAADGENAPGRAVNLYRNVNGTGAFQDMKIAETKGGVWTNEVKDDDGNIIVEKRELKGYFLPVSGNIHLADLNNDGWLDLVVDGWCDNNWDGIHHAGATAKIYLNRNGEKFEDVTPDIPTFEAVRSSATNIADFDNDGYLDYFFTGWGDQGYGWTALMYYNTWNKDCIYESNIQAAELGVDGTEGCRQIVRDFDGDGILDIYYAGACGCKVYYGNYNGSYNKLDDGVLPGYGSDGAAAVADFNGNGLSSIFAVGYGIKPFVYLNEGAAVEAPEAPANVSVERVDGKLVISWDYDESAAVEGNLAYNVFVQKANGEKFFMVPADEETGMVKVGEGREAALRPTVFTHTLNYDGEAKVGVQAISLANETASKFTFATTSGVEKLEAAAETQKVTVAGDAVTVAGNGEAVSIYNVTGQKVAAGVAGEAITVEGHGVFLVTTATATTKIVK